VAAVAEADRFPVRWAPREPPLAPSAALGLGPVAARLAARLLRGPGGLDAVMAEGLLLVLGPADRLPWVDGVLYLGADSDAPLLLMPTTERPEVHVALVDEAVRARVGRRGQRVALVPAARRIILLDGARPPSPGALERLARS
jgi:hypothetical protein